MFELRPAVMWRCEDTSKLQFLIFKDCRDVLCARKYATVLAACRFIGMPDASSDRRTCEGVSVANSVENEVGGRGLNDMFRDLRVWEEEEEEEEEG